MGKSQFTLEAATSADRLRPMPTRFVVAALAGLALCSVANSEATPPRTPIPTTPSSPAESKAAQVWLIERTGPGPAKLTSTIQWKDIGNYSLLAKVGFEKQSKGKRKFDKASISVGRDMNGPGYTAHNPAIYSEQTGTIALPCADIVCGNPNSDIVLNSEPITSETKPVDKSFYIIAEGIKGVKISRSPGWRTRQLPMTTVRTVRHSGAGVSAGAGTTPTTVEIFRGAKVDGGIYGSLGFVPDFPCPSEDHVRNGLIPTGPELFLDGGQPGFDHQPMDCTGFRKTALAITNKSTSWQVTINPANKAGALIGMADSADRLIVIDLPRMI